MKMYVYISYSKGPLQIIIALVLLYQQMQWSIISGIAILVLMIPINLFLQSIQNKLMVWMCLYNRFR
jgi:hypothetical protein